MALDVTDWIATRRLTAEDGSTIDVSIGLPRPAAKDSIRPEDWVCAFRYVRDGKVETKEVKGHDGFEALLFALAGISRDLDEEHLTWIPELGEYPGFHRIVIADPEMMDRRKLYKDVDDLYVRHQEEALARKRADKGTPEG